MARTKVRADGSKEASVPTLVQHVVAAMRQRCAERRLALNLEFRDGHRESLGGNASVTLGLNRPEAARCLLGPGLGTLGQTCVEGDIDPVGPAQGVVRLAFALSRGFVGPHLLPWIAWRPWCHSVAGDARAIAQSPD